MHAAAVHAAADHSLLCLNSPGQGAPHGAEEAETETEGSHWQAGAVAGAVADADGEHSESLFQQPNCANSRHYVLPPPPLLRDWGTEVARRVGGTVVARAAGLKETAAAETVVAAAAETVVVVGHVHMEKYPSNST